MLCVRVLASLSLSVTLSLSLSARFPSRKLHPLLRTTGSAAVRSLSILLVRCGRCLIAAEPDSPLPLFVLL